ncbi:MAG: OB-fold domain-containing protein [Gemmatimonadetes bacterium]|nr:OB-fold domain-containing protein [Gemmatimonadota bacterium]
MSGSERESRRSPVREGLWTVPADGEPRLLGHRCRVCGEVFFPRRVTGTCSRCYSQRLDEVQLGPLGRIATFTAVMQPPAGGRYRGSVPFCYGIVELDDGVRVKGHIAAAPDRLRTGMRVKLSIDELGRGEADDVVEIYRFHPTGE